MNKLPMLGESRNSMKAECDKFRSRVGSCCNGVDGSAGVYPGMSMYVYIYKGNGNTMWAEATDRVWAPRGGLFVK